VAVSGRDATRPAAAASEPGNASPASSVARSSAALFEPARRMIKKVRLGMPRHLPGISVARRLFA
jgi:hypothetical protein